MAWLRLTAVNAGNDRHFRRHLTQSAEQRFAHEREHGALEAQCSSTHMHMNYIAVDAILNGTDAATGQEPGGLYSYRSKDQSSHSNPIR